MSDTHKELLEAAMPLVEYLKKHTQGNHMKVIVETDYVEVVQGVSGLSIEEVGNNRAETGNNRTETGNNRTDNAKN